MLNMEYLDIDDEEQGIKISQILAVLFGRKITLFSVWAGVFLISLLVLKFGIEPNQKVYYSDFNLIDSLSVSEKYSDGQSINIYDLITYDNIMHVAEEAGISKKDAESIYYSDSFSVKRVENKVSVEETVENEVYFHIELSSNKIKNSIKLRRFIQGIANLPNDKQKDILDKQANDIYLSLYDDDAKTYDMQILYLKNQYELLITRYKSLISTYGNVFLDDGKKLSDDIVMIEEFFKNNSFTDLENQVRTGGFVKGYENEKTIYESKVLTLEKEKNVSEAKLSNLVSQRDELIKNADNLQTVEISEYNSKIIELTLRICDIDKELEELNFKIDNLDKIRTDEDLKADIAQFEDHLDLIKAKLDNFTSNYESAIDYVSNNYSITYFETSSIIKETNTLGFIKLFVLPLLVGFCIALLVNLCIDGKKLTGKYKLVHISKIKEETDENNKAA